MKKNLLERVAGLSISKNNPIKLTFLLLITFLSTVNASNGYSQKNKININVADVTVAKIFSTIEKETDYRFVYSVNDVDINKRVSLKVSELDIIPFLNILFPEQDLDFKVIEDQVIIKKHVGSKKSALKTRKSEQPQLLQKVVRGYVFDKDSLPLPGVNVIIKNKRRGTTTNMGGEYQIQATSKDTLVFSFVGFSKKEIPVGGKENINVTLSPGDQLSEVVITSSYGTKQRKEHMVSSTYTVDAEEIKNLPFQRVDKLLDGIVPGLQYSPQSDNTSSARSRYSVSIRGDASLAASNEPLWILDGTPLFTGNRTNMTGMSTSVSPLSYLNPEDIESITVLKDAAATSLYGADGANGVILITTKRGRKGKVRFNVSARSGQSFIAENTRFKVLNGSQYMELAKESYNNAGRDMRYFPFTDNELNTYSETDTDWYDVFYDQGNTSQVGLSASGGSETSTYYISGGYFQDKSTIIGNKQERMSIRANNTTDITDKMEIDLSLGASYNVNDLFTPGDEYYENLPIISPYNNDGSYRQYYRIINGYNPDGSPIWEDQRFFNAVAEREQNDDNQRSFAFQGNLKYNYEFLEGIAYRLQLGVDYQSSNEDRYQSMKNWSGKDQSGNRVGYASVRSQDYLKWIMTHLLNVNKKFDKHSISGLLGYEMSKDQSRSVSATGGGFVNDHVRSVGHAADQDGSSSYRETARMSYFGNFTYSFDDRYNATLVGRRDGNSGFGEDAQWGNFASLGLAWNLHNEKFFRSNYLNRLKLKGSYGSNGNSRIGDQEAMGVYTFGDSFNYAGLPGAGMERSPNPQLSWETTYMTNLGVEMGAFDNRINLEIEVYRNKTERLISRLDVSRTTGALRVYRNVGAIENRGVEATLNTVNWKTDNFNWSTTIMASHNRNKLLELFNDIPKNQGNQRWEVGEDSNAYYLIRWAGVDPRDGYPLWYDTSGNITREYSAANRVIYKTSTPDLFGSIVNNFSYKNLSLRVQAAYVLGGYGFSSFGRGVSSDGLNIQTDNQSVNQLDRWQNPGDLALSPIPLWGVSTRSVMNSTRFLYNKTHIRLQNISLSYRMEKELSRKFGMNNLSLTLIGDNLGLWTPYDKSNRNSYKNNISGFPIETLVSLGLNASF